MRPLFAILFAATSLLRAQQPPLFRAETSLVQVRFHVTQKDHYVTDLKPADIILIEDGVPRPFTLFRSAATAVAETPVEITLLFDTSGSVTDAGLLNPLAFKESLLDTLGGARIAVYGFDRYLRRYTAPTRDYARLSAAFAVLRDPAAPSVPVEMSLPARSKSEERGATWLYEAVAATVRDAAAVPGDISRLLLIFSDGFPSTTTRPQFAAAAAVEAGIPVYPVVLGHRALIEQINAFRERQRPNRPELTGMLGLQAKEEQIQEFARLGELTGGRSFDPLVISLSVMRQVLGNMVAQVRTEYTVGFVPESGAAERTHKIEVRLRASALGKLRGGSRTVRH